MNRRRIFVLLDADYEMLYDEEGIMSPSLRLWGRNESRRVEVQVNDFLPYFYVEGTFKQVNEVINRDNPVIKEWLISEEECKKREYFGDIPKNLVKLIGRVPYQVPSIKNLFIKENMPVHEADIPFTRRFLLDKGLRALTSVMVEGDILFEDDNSLKLKCPHERISLVQNSTEIYQPLVLAFDIEVNEHGETIQEMLKAKLRRISAISFAWGKISTKTPKSEVLILDEDTDEAEKFLLTDFINKVRNIWPDIIISFNGTFFDIPYLEARLLRYGRTLGELAIFRGLQNKIIKSNIPVESYRLKGVAVVDLMPRTWGIHHISGKKNLDSIAEQVLGEKKIPLEKSLGELFRSGISGNINDRITFREYSLQDSLLTFRLATELGVSDNLELCRLSGYPLPEGILSTSRNIGEYELMRILVNRGILIPSKPTQEEIKKRNELKRKYPHLGGWVIDPIVDEALFVAILDFRSLYPNIVRTHNISGETLIPDSADLPPDQRFRSDSLGALTELMTRVLNERYQILNRIKDKKENKDENDLKILQKKQHSLKLMANSLLGASNYPRGRFYHHLLSNSITGIARELLSKKLRYWTAEFSEKHPYDVKLQYGDTDSIFVEFIINHQPTDFLNTINPDVRDQALNKLLKNISDYQDFLSKKLPEYLELQLEDIALRIILKRGRKKAYSYLSLLTNTVIIRGFEAVRSDWSPLARKTQRSLLERLLTDFSPKRIEKAENFILDVCFRILKAPIDELITLLTIRGPLRRSPQKYKSKTPAVGAFLHYCQENNLEPDTEWTNWDGFPYIIASGSKNQPQYQRAFHPEYFKNQNHQIDRIHYIREILGASNRFGISLSEKLVINRAFTIPLTAFFVNQEKELTN